MTPEENLKTALPSNRGQAILLLATTLADTLLSTTQLELTQLFAKQSNRLPLRKLRAVLDTLQKLGFLRFPN